MDCNVCNGICSGNHSNFFVMVQLFFFQQGSVTTSPGVSLVGYFCLRQTPRWTWALDTVWLRGLRSWWTRRLSRCWGWRPALSSSACPRREAGGKPWGKARQTRPSWSCWGALRSRWATTESPRCAPGPAGPARWCWPVRACSASIFGKEGQTRHRTRGARRAGGPRTG